MLNAIEIYKFHYNNDFVCPRESNISKYMTLSLIYISYVYQLNVHIIQRLSISVVFDRYAFLLQSRYFEFEK